MGSCCSSSDKPEAVSVDTSEKEAIIRRGDYIPEFTDLVTRITPTGLYFERFSTLPNRGHVGLGIHPHKAPRKFTVKIVVSQTCVRERD